MSVRAWTAVALVVAFGCSSPQAPTQPPVIINAGGNTFIVGNNLPGGPSTGGSPVPGGTAIVDHVKISAVGGGGSNDPHALVLGQPDKFLTCTPFTKEGIPLQTVAQVGDVPDFFGVCAGTGITCTQHSDNSYNTNCKADASGQRVFLCCNGVQGKSAEPFELRS